MTNRQNIGIAFMMMAGLFAMIAIRNAFVIPMIPVTDGSGLGVSQLVGACLPSVVCLAIGIWLFQKPKS